MPNKHPYTVGHTYARKGRFTVTSKLFLTRALSPIFIYNVPKSDTQIENIIKKYLSELENKKAFFKDINQSLITYYFVLSAQNLLSFKPTIIDVELTNSKSLLFFCTIGNFNNHLELFFEPNNEVEAVINIYQNKELILATNGKLDKIISKMKEYLKVPTIEYYEYVDSMSRNSNCIGNASIDELSETTLTEVYI
jgi:hypothetical protein